jgi:hypothetical protein
MKKKKMAKKKSTNQKQVEKEIKEQARFFEAITDANPDMINVVNLKTFGIEFANKRVYTEQGFSSPLQPSKKANVEEQRRSVHPDHLKTTKNYSEVFLKIKGNEVQKLGYKTVNDRGELHWFLTQERFLNEINKEFQFKRYSA